MRFLKENTITNFKLEYPEKGNYLELTVNFNETEILRIFILTF